MRAQTILDVNGVARRQGSRQILRLDFYDVETRPQGAIRDRLSNRIHPRLIGDNVGLREARGACDRREIDTEAGMAHLHAGFAIMAVVEDDDDEIGRRCDCDCRQAPQAHQLFAVAGHDQHFAIGHRLRQPQADQRRRTHGAPEIVIAVVVAGCMDVVARRTEPGHDEQAVAIAQQARDDVATIEGSNGWAHHCFTPSRRCAMMTATCWSAP